MTESSEPEPQADDDQLPISNSETTSSDTSGLEGTQGDQDIRKAQGIEESEPIKAEEGAESPVTIQQHSDFLLLLALFISFRLLTLFLLRPGGFIRDWSDFDTFLGIAATSDYGLYPFLHYWLEWPPLIPWLAVGAYKLSLLFPPWTDHRLWFVLILGGVFVLFETGNFVLLYRLSRRLYGNGPSADCGNQTLGHKSQLTDYVLRPLWLYALLFVPIYALLGFFDAITLFFLLLALELILGGRLLGSAVSVGVGFLVKLTPIIFVPVALRQLWCEAEDSRDGLRDGALYVVATVLTIVVLLLPFLLIRPVWLWTSARAVVGRSSWETVWALLEGYFGFGVVGGDRLNPTETAFAVHTSTLPWWLITLGFGLLYLFLWTRPADYRRPRNLIAFTGLTVTVFLLYSKGYSPQFIVYLLPFVLLLFPNWRGVTYSLLLTLLNVLEQPVYFVLIPEAAWLLEAIILTRWLILAALLLEFGWVLWGSSMPRLTSLRRYAPVGLSVLVGLGLVIAIPAMGRAYAEQRSSEDPAASLIGYLGTEQAQDETEVLLVTDQDFLRQVTPYVVGDYQVRLAGGDNLYEAAPTVADLTAEIEKVWVVATGDAASRVEQALDSQSHSLLTYDFGEGGELQLFASRQGGVAPLPPVARLTSGANLIGYTLERPTWNRLRVTLYWWAAGTPRQSYTVFTQVLDGEGGLIAGHDSLPVDGTAPTESWVTGRVYADTHLIQLPPNLPPGKYSVVAGMYDVNLNRLIPTGPDATIFKDRAVPLGEIELP
jgi:hypothetical protein